MKKITAQKFEKASFVKAAGKITKARAVPLNGISCKGIPDILDINPI